MNRCFDVIPTPKYFKNSGNSAFMPKKLFVQSDSSIVRAAIDVLCEGCEIEYTKRSLADLTVDIGESAEWLSDADTEALSQKYADAQGYVIRHCGGVTKVFAICPQGAAYALLTLAQLVGKPVGDFHICDYPDFKYRGVKWTVWAEAGCLSFDFGDGIDAMRERMLHRVDTMFKYKLNYVHADGFGFDSDRFEGYAELLRTVCDYAMTRGIRISVGGYTMSYGMVGHLNSLQGKHFENRKSYPDGEIYECIGTFDPGVDNNRIMGATRGTCLSNSALFDLKLDEISEFVKKTHVGALYLHNMDADEIHPELWAARCECCRRRWPSDSLFDKNGCAGAFAEFIDSITERLSALTDTNRNAPLISIVSPGYLYAKRSTDAVFDIGVKFWGAVSEYLKHPDNVLITFREQFYYHEKPIMRVENIEKTIRRTMSEVCNFSGGDGYYDDSIFTLTASTNYILKGFDANIMMNGNALQEPLTVFNAEYLWSCDDSAFYNAPRPTNYEDFLKLYQDMLSSGLRPDEVFGTDGMLEVICRKLYGDPVGKIMAELYSLCGKEGEPPIATASNVNIYTNYSKVVYPMRWDNEMERAEIDEKLQRFTQCHEMSTRAHSLCNEALLNPDINPKVRSQIKMLSECFLMGAGLTEALREYMKVYGALDAKFKSGEPFGDDIQKNLESLKALVREFENYVEKNAKPTLDKFGGIHIRRQEMAEFLKYNTEIMCRSIDENKRIPEGLKPLPTREWW